MATLLEELLGALGLGVLAGAGQVEVRRGDEQVGGVGRRDRVADEPMALVAERQPVLRLERSGLRLRVVGRPLVERDDALPRLVDELLPELDRLGQDDLFLGGQQRDLADLLQVHPDRVVDADHVGREGLELGGGGLLELLRRRAWRARRPGILEARASASSPTTSTVASSSTSSAASGDIGLVVVLVLVVIDVVEGGAGRAKAGELGLLEVGLAPPRAGQDGFDELLVKGIDRHGGLTSGWLDGEEMGLVATAVQRLALLVHGLALAQELVDRRAIGGLLGLRERRVDVVGALVQRALLEIDGQTLDLVGEIRLGQCARVRIAAGDHGLGERRGLRVEALDQRRQAERRVHALVVGLAGEHDGAEQLARDGARQLVRPDRVDDPQLELRHEQEQAQELRLLRQHAAENLAHGQRIRGGDDRVGGEPALARRGRALGAATESRRPGPCDVPASPDAPPSRVPAQDLEQHALLDARHAMDELEVGVAHHRVRDGADGRHERVDEARLAARRLEVVRLRVRVHEVLDDRLRGPNLLAPAIGRVAQDLVGILAVRHPDDADLVELDAALGRGELADQALERLHAERAGLLAGRVDVVRERDPLRIPGEQRDLARRERRSERGDDVVEAGLVGHQRVRVALDDDRLAGLAHRALGLVDEVQRAALVEQRRARACSGTWGRCPDRRPPPAPRIRPPMPVAAPFWSRIGNRTRPRNLSMTPTPRCGERAGEARPASTSSSGVMPRFSTSFRLIVSQPSGAQPSWNVSMVASVKPRPRR